MTATPTQAQLSQLRTKYESQVKKNNSLLKMNSNLMKENQAYLNCFNLLKQWSNCFFSKIGQSECSEQFDDSCIDIQEEGEQFINKLTQLIDKKMQELNNLLIMEKQQQIAVSNISPLMTPTNNNMLSNNTQTTFRFQQQQQQQQQCSDCNRWKQLYIKQTKQTSKLQKLIDDSTTFNTQKQINFTKLKDDTLQLLQSYLKLYRKQLQINNGKNNSSSNQFAKEELDEQSVKVITNHINHNKETVRPAGKVKQKRQTTNSGQKIKKSLGNNQSHQITKQPSPFSKQKTSRKDNIKYAIELSPPKSFISQQNDKLNNNYLPSNPQQTQLSKCLKDILSSYSELSKNLEQQNNQLKEQLKDLSEILHIYRQRERNQILFR